MDEPQQCGYEDNKSFSAPRQRQPTAHSIVFDRYLMKNLLWATLFTALSLAAVIMLTQSLH